MLSNRRVNIKKILADPALRERLMIKTIIATQAREGIVTTLEQAKKAYNKTKVDNIGNCGMINP
jgi:hypothetical protein